MDATPSKTGWSGKFAAAALLFHLGFLYLMLLGRTYGNGSPRPPSCSYPCTYHWHGSLLLLFLPELVAIPLSGVAVWLGPRWAWRSLPLVVCAAVAGVIVAVLTHVSLTDALWKT